MDEARASVPRFRASHSKMSRKQLAGAGVVRLGHPAICLGYNHVLSMIVHNHVEASADLGPATRPNPANAEAEFRILLNSAGVLDLSSRARISLSGSDRVRWLNGMVTNNIRDLAAGHGVYAFLLNPQGHILGDMYAYHRGDSLLVDTDQSQAQKMLGIFDHYIIMDDVEVANISDKIAALGLAGPGAREVLGTVGLDLPELQPLQFSALSCRDLDMTIVRSDYPGVEFYEMWLAPQSVPSFWKALIKAGANPVSSGALEWLRIACGIPKYGQDIRERDLPQETEQQRALHFNKGCYVGQEIVERIRSRGAVHRKFTGFRVNGTLPAPGTKIQADGKDVGEVTSAASLPTKAGQAPPLQVALGYIRRELAAPGKELQVGEARLTVAQVPFAEVFEK